MIEFGYSFWSFVYNFGYVISSPFIMLSILCFLEILYCLVDSSDSPTISLNILNNFLVGYLDLSIQIIITLYILWSSKPDAIWNGIALRLSSFWISTQKWKLIYKTFNWFWLMLLVSISYMTYWSFYNNYELWIFNTYQVIIFYPQKVWILFTSISFYIIICSFIMLL